MSYELASSITAWSTADVVPVTGELVRLLCPKDPDSITLSRFWSVVDGRKQHAPSGVLFVEGHGGSEGHQRIFLELLFDVCPHLRASSRLRRPEGLGS